MKIEVVNLDITLETTDAIVNAANSKLAGGGGVDGAIHQKAGPNLLQECQAIIKERGACPAGDAVLTAAGNLPTKYVIHAVGPIWQGGSHGEDQLLVQAYQKSLELANQKKLQSISFSNISTGVYGFPKERAAFLVYETIKDFLSKPTSLEKIRFVCFDQENYQIYLKQFYHLLK